MRNNINIDTLWKYTDAEIKNIMHKCTGSNSIRTRTSNINMENNDDDSLDGKEIKISVDTKSAKNTNMLLYFPHSTRKPLVRIKPRTNYQTIQHTIADNLQNFKSAQINACRVILWVEGMFFRVSGIENTLIIKNCGVAISNSNGRFQKAIKNCPILIKTNGKCRIMSLCLLLNEENRFAAETQKECVMVPFQSLNEFNYPAGHRFPRDADPRVDRPHYPVVISEEEAKNIVVGKLKEEAKFMNTSEEDIFADSDDDDDDDESNSVETQNRYPRVHRQVYEHNDNMKTLPSSPLTNNIYETTNDNNNNDFYDDNHISETMELGDDDYTEWEEQTELPDEDELAYDTPITAILSGLPIFLLVK